MADYILSNEAEADLDSILYYVAADSIQSALNVYDRVHIRQ